MFDITEKRQLLVIAAAAIQHGLRHGEPGGIEAGDYPPALRQTRASFVTLKIAGELRGCIGTIEACRPLAQDVSRNAYAAAFEDPRFPPLEENEYGALDVHIAVLTPPESMEFTSESDLLAQLRPGIDGLLLEAGPHQRGTFLPAVWEMLADPRDFLRQLKRKAGLPPDYWSPALRVRRYMAESIASEETD